MSNQQTFEIPTPCGKVIINQSWTFEPSPSDYTPASEGEIALWWNDLDITASPVTSWKDRVKGAEWKAASGSVTKDANGLTFNGKSHLESVNADIGALGGSANGAYWFLIKLNPDLIKKQQQPIMWGVNGYRFGFENNLGGRFYHGAWVSCYQPVAVTADWTDLCVTSLVTDSWFYKDGALVIHNHQSCGEIPNDAQWRWLGRDNGGLPTSGVQGNGSYFTGQIKEIIAYKSALTPESIARLHTYAQTRLGK